MAEHEERDIRDTLHEEDNKEVTIQIYLSTVKAFLNTLLLNIKWRCLLFVLLSIYSVYLREESMQYCEANVRFFPPLSVPWKNNFPDE